MGRRHHPGRNGPRVSSTPGAWASAVVARRTPDQAAGAGSDARPVGHSHALPAAQGLVEAMEERDLRRLDPDDALGRIEPRHAVDREALDAGVFVAARSPSLAPDRACGGSRSRSEARACATVPRAASTAPAGTSRAMVPDLLAKTRGRAASMQRLVGVRLALGIVQCPASRRAKSGRRMRQRDLEAARPGDGGSRRDPHASMVASAPSRSRHSACRWCRAVAGSTTTRSKRSGKPGRPRRPGSVAQVQQTRRRPPAPGVACGDRRSPREGRTRGSSRQRTSTTTSARRWTRVDRHEVDLMATDMDVPGQDRPANGRETVGDQRLGGIAGPLRRASWSGGSADPCRDRVRGRSPGDGCRDVNRALIRRTTAGHLQRGRGRRHRTRHRRP